MKIDKAEIAGKYKNSRRKKFDFNGVKESLESGELEKAQEQLSIIGEKITKDDLGKKTLALIWSLLETVEHKIASPDDLQLREINSILKPLGEIYDRSTKKQEEKSNVVNHFNLFMDRIESVAPDVLKLPEVAIDVEFEVSDDTVD